MKNVIKNTIYKIGKIYIGNDISELNTYLKNMRLGIFVGFRSARIFDTDENR